MSISKLTFNLAFNVKRNSNQSHTNLLKKLSCTPKLYPQKSIGLQSMPKVLLLLLLLLIMWQKFKVGF